MKEKTSSRETVNDIAASAKQQGSALAMPIRVQLRRSAGWKMPPNTVSVARPGRWGNPFYVSRWRDAATCVALFRDAMAGIWNPATSAHVAPAWSGYDEHQQWRNKMDGHPMELVRELRGKNLACWCKQGEPCHADVLLELANSDPARTTGGMGT